MPPIVDWTEIALRLALTLVAGASLGFNRTERGRTAGLRTTMLVALAAAVAMIQVNLLLVTVGRTSTSFVEIDPMRLPLGVLTGMGFIGAGAILRRGGRVSGITTAATLWLATVLGLSFGGGQHLLGLAGLGIGLVILRTLKSVEALIPQERLGALSLLIGADGPTDEEIVALISSREGKVSDWDATYHRTGGTVRRRVSCEVRCPAHPNDPAVPTFVRTLAETVGVTAVRWRGHRGGL